MEFFSESIDFFVVLCYSIEENMRYHGGDKKILKTKGRVISYEINGNG